jgi:hypothetical protein
MLHREIKMGMTVYHVTLVNLGSGRVVSFEDRSHNTVRGDRVQRHYRVDWSSGRTLWHLVRELRKTPNQRKLVAYQTAMEAKARALRQQS